MAGFRLTGLSLISLFAVAATARDGVGSAAGVPAEESRWIGDATRVIEEVSIADIHMAFQIGSLTCRELLERYIERIVAYDRRGPSLNSIVLINPAALPAADSLDARFARSGLTGSLHCIPVIVKDNFETIDMPTSAGSASLAGFTSTRDATVVRRLREAGAIMLAKSNMAEFAFSPIETVSSVIPGPTRNAYAPDRVPAGSSGGTATAVASSFGAVGLGTDTGNSIRGPASHLSLVGIRSTMGLVSRAGIVPLNMGTDIPGPLARTVADAVAVFQVIAGYDPADPATEASRGRPLQDYSKSLDSRALRGARIGVLRQAYERPSANAEVLSVFARALVDLRRAGATVIDTVVIPQLDELQAARRGTCNSFKFDFERWLQSTNGRAPVSTLAEVVASGRFHPSIRGRLEAALAVEQPPEVNPACQSREQFREALRASVLATMDRLGLDALVYPTWSNPPRLLGDLESPHGDNSQLFAPSTGWPAIQVPMGYTENGTLPAGITFFGRAWSEPALIGFAYAYEQLTMHRRAPSSVPPLR